MLCCWGDFCDGLGGGGLGGAAPHGRPVALTLGPPLNLPLERGRGMARGRGDTLLLVWGTALNGEVSEPRITLIFADGL